MPQNPSGPCGKNEDSGLENGCPIAAWLATGYGGVSWEWNICNIAVGGVVVVPALVCATFLPAIDSATVGGRTGIRTGPGMGLLDGSSVTCRRFDRGHAYGRG